MATTRNRSSRESRSNTSCPSSSSHSKVGVATSLLQPLNESEHLTAVDQAVISEFTSQEIRDLKMVFDVFDREQKGYIDPFELRRAMRVLGFKLSHQETDEAIADLRSGRVGEVRFNDFLELIVHRQGDSRDIHAEIHQGFDMMDYGKKGRLTSEDLKIAAKEAGVKISDNMVREMIDEADMTGDNTVNRNEFIAVMLQTNLYSE